MIGRVLSDRYLIAAELGTGGMATVYKGVDQKLGRTVAIKVIHPGISTDPSFAEHFMTEGRNAAALNHPNIVGVYDLGEDGGTQYIVLEFVHGRTLQEVLADGPLPLERALEYGRHIALALAEAHERGILHCDVKPQNVLVTQGGVAKLADFGISRLGASTGLVTGAMIVGTLDYLAPEQIEGKKPNERTDVYALGLVIYQMLAGRLPFDPAQTPPQALAQRVAADPKPLSEVCGGIPSSLEALVMGVLCRNPSRRYMTAALMADALAHFADSGGREYPRSMLNEDPTVAISIPAQIGKNRWWKRHARAPVLGMMGLVVVGGMVGIIAMSSANRTAFSNGLPVSGDGAASDLGDGMRHLGGTFVGMLLPPTATSTFTVTPTHTPRPTSTPTPTSTPPPTPTPASYRAPAVGPVKIDPGREHMVSLGFLKQGTRLRVRVRVNFNSRLSSLFNAPAIDVYVGTYGRTKSDFVKIGQWERAGDLFEFGWVAPKDADYAIDLSNRRSAISAQWVTLQFLEPPR